MKFLPGFTFSESAQQIVDTGSYSVSGASSLYTVSYQDRKILSWRGKTDEAYNMLRGFEKNQESLAHMLDINPKLKFSREATQESLGYYSRKNHDAVLSKSRVSLNAFSFIPDEYCETFRPKITDWVAYMDKIGMDVEAFPRAVEFRGGLSIASVKFNGVKTILIVDASHRQVWVLEDGRLASLLSPGISSALDKLSMLSDF